MSARTFTLVFALALATLVPARRASAIEWLGAKLPNGPGQPWHYSVDGHKAAPAGIDRLKVEQSFKTAFNLWQGIPCQYLSFTYDGVDSVHGLAQPDKVNVMGLVLESIGDDPEFYDNALGGGGAIAAAATLYYGGTIYECDIGINAVNYPWGTSGSGSVFDLQSIALHESGHCLGLAHSADPEAAMYGSLSLGELRRGINNTDQLNLCGVYPKAGAVGSPCADTAHSCTNGLTCVGSGATAFCTKGCEPGAANACPIGFSCITPSKVWGEPGSCDFGGSSSIKVGAPCTLPTRREDCGDVADSMCLVYDSIADRWADGYCMADCTTNPCPDNSHCYDLLNGGGGIDRRCLKDCRPGMGDCRYYYACEPVGDGLGRCIPECHSDDECNGGQCRNCDGLCIPAGGPKSVGDFCTDSAECPAGGVCRTDINRGLCVMPCASTCDVCPQGSTCTTYRPTGEKLCFKDCPNGPSDCPQGQGCFEAGSIRTCQPACFTDDDCPMGVFCRNDSCMRDPGFDGGTCTLCDHRDASTPAGPDAAQPPGKPVPKGCGCDSTGGTALLVVFGSLILIPTLRRRSRCRT
ncbi:MAG: matrixin family metalloprotease [Myxococcales bacterium]